MSKNVTQNQLNKILAAVFAGLTVVLLGATGAAYAGHNFATQQVSNQLKQEKISFPPAGSAGLDAKEFPGLQKYGGQPVDTGVKAKAYADEFIWKHMMKASGDKTYAEVSTASMANPSDQKLAGLKNTLFQGDMLRSSLLTAYAFSVFGTIAGTALPLAAVASFITFLLAVSYLAKAKRS